MHDLSFFNPYAEIHHTGNLLPHWQQSGAVYFLTFRLNDALPFHMVTRWKEERDVWLGYHPEPWSKEVEREYHERFSRTIEDWLDAGDGSCLLKRRDCAVVVVMH